MFHVKSGCFFTVLLIHLPNFLVQIKLHFARLWFCQKGFLLPFPLSPWQIGSAEILLLKQELSSRVEEIENMKWTDMAFKAINEGTDDAC